MRQEIFEGVTHNFPDDATEQEISEAMNALPSGDKDKKPVVDTRSRWQKTTDAIKSAGATALNWTARQLDRPYAAARGVTSSLQQNPNDLQATADEAAKGFAHPEQVPTAAEIAAKAGVSTEPQRQIYTPPPGPQFNFKTLNYERAKPETTYASPAERVGAGADVLGGFTVGEGLGSITKLPWVAAIKKAIPTVVTKGSSVLTRVSPEALTEASTGAGRVAQKAATKFGPSLRLHTGDPLAEPVKNALAGYTNKIDAFPIFSQLKDAKEALGNEKVLSSQAKIGLKKLNEIMGRLKVNKGGVVKSSQFIITKLDPVEYVGLRGNLEELGRILDEQGNSLFKPWVEASKSYLDKAIIDNAPAASKDILKTWISRPATYERAQEFGSKGVPPWIPKSIGTKGAMGGLVGEVLAPVAASHMGISPWLSVPTEIAADLAASPKVATRLTIPVARNIPPFLDKFAKNYPKVAGPNAALLYQNRNRVTPPEPPLDTANIENMHRQNNTLSKEEAHKYLDATGGDMKKAKQKAALDGWSF